jgi:hypothetical protein
LGDIRGGSGEVRLTQNGISGGIVGLCSRELMNNYAIVECISDKQGAVSAYGYTSGEVEAICTASSSVGYKICLAIDHICGSAISLEPGIVIPKHTRVGAISYIEIARSIYCST